MRTEGVIDFRHSRWLIIDVNSVLGSLYRVEVADVSTFQRYMLPPTSGGSMYLSKVGTSPQSYGVTTPRTELTSVR
jgi:hypothetical protein